MIPPFHAFFRRISFLLFFLVAATGFGLDWVTKERVFAALGMPGEYMAEPHGVYWIVDGVFGFQTSLNEGALFGMGQGWVIPLAIISLVALVGVAVWVWYSALQNPLLSITLGMITAGILGNLYDRLGLHALRWNYNDLRTGIDRIGEPVYAVRDWILVMIGSYHWPNFNVADSLLVCGAILLFFQMLLTPDDTAPIKQEKPQGDADASPPA